MPDGGEILIPAIMQDGVLQLADALAGRSRLDAIHFVFAWVGGEFESGQRDAGPLQHRKLWCYLEASCQHFPVRRGRSTRWPDRGEEMAPAGRSSSGELLDAFVGFAVN